MMLDDCRRPDIRYQLPVCSRGLRSPSSDTSLLIFRLRDYSIANGGFVFLIFYGGGEMERRWVQSEGFMQRCLDARRAEAVAMLSWPCMNI